MVSIFWQLCLLVSQSIVIVYYSIFINLVVSNFNTAFITLVDKLYISWFIFVHTCKILPLHMQWTWNLIHNLSLFAGICELSSVFITFPYLLAYASYLQCIYEDHQTWFLMCVFSNICEIFISESGRSCPIYNGQQQILFKIHNNYMELCSKFCLLKTLIFYVQPLYQSYKYIQLIASNYMLRILIELSNSWLSITIWALIQISLCKFQRRRVFGGNGVSFYVSPVFRGELFSVLFLFDCCFWIVDFRLQWL